MLNLFFARMRDVCFLSCKASDKCEFFPFTSFNGLGVGFLSAKKLDNYPRSVGNRSIYGASRSLKWVHLFIECGS